MIRTDLHIHTRWCDGKNTPEEMVLAAIEKGMECIGFSCHSYTWFEEECCIAKEKIPAYVTEIRTLAEQYAGKIRILCGVEQDYDSAEEPAWADYVIGSVHFLSHNGQFLAIDNTEEEFCRLLKEEFRGDIYAMAEAYYAKVAVVAEKTKADIIGHFDLISKYNEGGTYFDETHSRYRAAWKKAADALLAAGKTFEINTGAMFRGYRSRPYPNAEMIDYLRAAGGRLILSSDAHCTEAIGYRFEDYEYLIKNN